MPSSKSSNCTTVSSDPNIELLYSQIMGSSNRSMVSTHGLGLRSFFGSGDDWSICETSSHRSRLYHELSNGQSLASQIDPSAMRSIVEMGGRSRKAEELTLRVEWESC
jgi:hypothetical protein